MTRSDYFRFRTGASGLTDDELLIFDALQQFSGLDVRDLTQFCLLALNAAASHSFTDSEVFRRVDAWVEQGLLEYEPLDPKVVSFTPEGGHLWEAERLPVWERHYQWWEDPQRHRLEVISPSRNLTKTLVRSGQLRGDLRPFGHWRLRQCALDWRSGWRPYTKVWKLTVRFEPNLRPLRQPDGRKESVWWSVRALVQLRLDGKLPWPG